MRISNLSVLAVALWDYAKEKKNERKARKARGEVSEVEAIMNIRKDDTKQMKRAKLAAQICLGLFVGTICGGILGMLLIIIWDLG